MLNTFPYIRSVQLLKKGHLEIKSSKINWLLPADLWVTVIFHPAQDNGEQVNCMYTHQGIRKR